MLKLGEKIISDIYLGDKKIAKAFLGDKLVYQANKPIFLDYVAFDGASYIDTGINRQPCTIECTVKLESTGYRQFLGAWSELGGYYIAVDKSNQFELGAGRVLTGSNATELSNIVATHTETNMTLTVNGKSITRDNQTGITYTYWLGEMQSPSYTGFIKGQVYGHKFTSPDGTLIQDLRPAIDPKGVVCMYDMVTKKYFYNQGTGTLKAGGRFVESILFDGESYIDTGIIPTDNTGAYIKYTNTGAYLDSVILGYRGEVFSSMRFFLLASYNCSVSIGRGAYAYLKTDGEWGNAQDFSTLNTSTEVWSNYLNSRVVRAKFGDTDITSVEIPEITFTPSGSLFLGAENRNNTDVVNHYKGEIDRCVITEGGTIIQDLRPYVDENGTACFKDIVTGNLFYNQGTGKLEYTE